MGWITWAPISSQSHSLFVVWVVSLRDIKTIVEANNYHSCPKIDLKFGSSYRFLSQLKLKFLDFPKCWSTLWVNARCVDNQKDFIKRIFNLQIALTLVATLVLAEDLAPAADAEDAQLVAKKHEKRGLSSLGYSYEAPLGYNSNYNSIGYNRLVSPIAYSRGSLLTFG